MLNYSEIILLTSYTRAASRLNSRQPSVPRQPSVDRTSLTTPGTGTATPIAGNGSAIGAGAIITPAGVSAGLPTIPPFEEVLMRKKGLGQDILPSPGQPKRTESLYLNPGGKGAVAAAAAPAKVSILIILLIIRILSEVYIIIIIIVGGTERGEGGEFKELSSLTYGLEKLY